MRGLGAVIVAVAIVAAGRARAADAGPAIGQPPSVHQKDMVEDWFAPNLLLPQTALWQFAPLKDYVDGKRLVCGRVNFQSAMRRYIGYHRFYAILDTDKVTGAQIEDDPMDTSGRLKGKLDTLCGAA